MTYAHIPDTEKPATETGLTTKQVEDARKVYKDTDADKAAAGYYVESYPPTSLCSPTYPDLPTLDGSDPPQAVYTPVPLSDADCDAAIESQLNAAKQQKVAELTAQRDARLSGYLWFNATGTECWYAMGRTGDYFARLSMLSAADAADTVNAPHSKPLTCLLGTGPSAGKETDLVIGVPDGTVPQQIDHSAAHIQAVIAHGEPYITDTWATWNALVVQAGQAATQADLDVVVWP